MNEWEKEIHALLQSLCMKSKGLFIPTASGSLKPSCLLEPGSSQLSTCLPFEAPCPFGSRTVSDTKAPWSRLSWKAGVMHAADCEAHSFTRVSYSTGWPASEAARGEPEMLQTPRNRGLCDNHSQTPADS